MNTKKVIPSLFFVVLLLAVYLLYPTKDIFQNTITMLVFFVLLPVFFILFFHRKKISELGFQIGNYKEGLIWGGSLMAVCLIVVGYLVSHGVIKGYILPQDIHTNFGSFLIYEFIFVLFFSLIYEFFLRSFLMFCVGENFGYYGVIFQAATLCLLLIISRSSFSSLFPYVIFAPFAGFIAFRSRSIIYSLGAQFLFIFFLDVFLIHLVK